MAKLDVHAAASILIMRYGRYAEMQALQKIARLKAIGEEQAASDLQEVLETVERLRLGSGKIVPQ